MSDDELGPQPTPEATEPEKFPGGADNLADEEKYGDRGTLDGPAPRDLDPAKNPAVEAGAPEEVATPEDKQQESDEGSKDQEMGATGEEPEAGQTDEQGGTEDPA